MPQPTVGASFRRVLSFAIIAALSFAVLSPAGALALKRTSGDFWTYELTASQLGVNVTGNVTYAFEREQTLTVGGSPVQVNVMSINGSLSGSAALFIPVEVGATLRGEAYETVQDWAFAGIDETVYLNASLGIPPAQFVTHSSIASVLQFSPSLFSGFHPSSVAPGDSWTESVRETGTVVTVNGTEPPVTHLVNTTLTFDVVVGPAYEKLSTPAGTFDCLLLTATNSSGEKVEIWWNEAVGNAVAAKAYQNGSGPPTVTLTLKDYSKKAAGTSSVYLLAGVGIVVVAVVVLAAVLMMRRRPKSPAPAQPSPPEAEREG